MSEKDTSVDDTQPLLDDDVNDGILGMSDEDFLKLQDNPTESAEVANTSNDDSSEDIDDVEEPTDTEEQLSDETSDEVTEPLVGSDEEEESQDDKDTDDSSNSDSTEPNYKEVYEKIMKPFKANGKVITPESPEDVISLMQMGSNYVKKMSVLKPSLKVMKTLEKEGIDENQLNFLIDIKNKNPEAIKKLIKDAELDPIDIDLDTLDYKPSNKVMSDSEAVFDDVVSEIQDSPKFNVTKEIVTKLWDKESRKKIADNPELLKGLHEEVEYDRFEKIQAIVDRERLFGRLDGVSDIDAYVMTVRKVIADEAPKTDNKPTDSIIKKPVDKTINKKAAQPTSKKASTTSVKYTDDQILSMSDEEFLRLSNKNLY